jgi:hypothetical protein
MVLIKSVGVHWARNKENLEELEKKVSRKSGIYLLYHGAMPVYIGRGILVKRLMAHNREGSKKRELWDRFSWFVVNDDTHEKTLESLLLQALPFYVRAFNKQVGKFPKKIRHVHVCDKLTYVKFPKLVPIRRKKRSY